MILDPSVYSPQQSGEFIDLPSVQVKGVGFTRRLVAVDACDVLVAPFDWMFVLKLHLSHFVGDVAFQTLAALPGGQMFGRGGPHRRGFLPYRKPYQAADDEDDDCYKDQVAGLHFHQMISGFDLYSIYYERNSDRQCS